MTIHRNEQVEFVWKFMTCLIRNALEMHCVLHIVAVARTHFSQHLNEAIVSCVRPQRLQDSQTKEAPSEVILSGFGDQACRSPRTQRIIMAALNGTFFNLMQVPAQNIIKIITVQQCLPRLVQFGDWPARSVSVLNIHHTCLGTLPQTS